MPPRLRLEGVVGALLNGPWPLRLMSNVDTKLSDPAKKWFGFSSGKSNECGAMYRSVVRETRGYDATIDWLNGDSSRIGRA